MMAMHDECVAFTDGCLRDWFGRFVETSFLRISFKLFWGLVGSGRAKCFFQTRRLLLSMNVSSVRSNRLPRVAFLNQSLGRVTNVELLRAFKNFEFVPIERHRNRRSRQTA